MHAKFSALPLTLALAGGVVLPAYGEGIAAVPFTVGQGPSSSATPYLTPIASEVRFASVLTTGDAVGAYRMGGNPDGLGAYDNHDGTFTVLMNHELGHTLGVPRAHGAKGAYVSEWVIDKTSLQVKSGADLIQKVYRENPATSLWDASAAVAFNRFCSADLPAASALYNTKSGNGTQARIFLAGEESAPARGMAIVATGTDKGKAYVLPWAGPYTTRLAGWENLLAHPDAGDNTVVMANSDGGDNGVYLYVGTKQNHGNEVEKAGLVGGLAYRVVVTGGAVETQAADAGLGLVSRTNSFSLVPNTAAGVAGTQFLRPEDGAWDTLNKNRYYFVTTNTVDGTKDGSNPDTATTTVGRTRVWSLLFTDLTRPALGGVIEMVLDGTQTITVAGRTHGPQMLDNLTVATDGTLILQEDVGANIHNGKIWKYQPVSKQLTLLAQHDVARFGDYLPTVTVGTLTKDEESSGVIEITTVLGRTDGQRYFLIADQVHRTDTSANATELVHGGQLTLMSTPN